MLLGHPILKKDMLPLDFDFQNGSHRLSNPNIILETNIIRGKTIIKATTTTSSTKTN